MREAKAAAARRGSTLAALVSDSLDRALLEENGRDEPPGHELLESMRWYERNRRRLLSRYGGQYIAVLQGAVMDHDRDFEALAARVFARLGSGPVYMPRVQDGEARARVRSPRQMRP